MSKLDSMAIASTTISDIVPVFHASRVTPMLVGKPGIGKTDLVREGAALRSAQLSQELGRPVRVHVRELHLASMSEVDVRGFLMPVTEGANIPPPAPGVPPLPVAAQPKPVTRATFTQPEFWREVEANEFGILFLDEFPQATHEVQKAVAPLLLDGRIGEFVLPKGWSVMLAGNGIEDNAGANTLLSHIVNRISIIKVNAPDPEVWQSWAMANGLEPEVVTYAKLKPATVFNGEIPNEADEPYCTPRSLHRVSTVAKSFPGGIRGMVRERHGQAIIAGLVGAGVAAELSAVVNMAMNLPSYEEVVANPSGVRMPEKVDEKYAMMIMVATRARIEDAQQVCEYLTRFDANLSMAGIVSLIRRNIAFATNPIVTAWIMANQAGITKFNKYIVQGLRK